MENLTRSLRIAFSVSDCSPVPDHDLVIFKKVGSTGLEFREWVPAGKRFQKKLFELGDFEGFAVSRDENLHYAFSQADTHSDQRHTYVLHFTVYYSVSNSRRIVEKLETDPLKRLKEKTLSILGGTARQIDWQIILEGTRALEQNLIEHKSIYEQNVEFSNLERLCQIAQDLGLNVKSVSIQRTLPTEGKVSQTDYMESLENRLALNRKDREQKLLGFENADVDAAINRTVLGSISKVKDVTSAIEARNVIESLEGVGSAARKVIARGQPCENTAQELRMLPAAMKDGLLGDLTVMVWDLISDLGNDFPAGRRLGSVLLHLVAELSLGKEAEDTVLEKYAEDLGGPLRDVAKRLNKPQQIELIDRLREPLRLKAEISREEAR